MVLSIYEYAVCDDVDKCTGDEVSCSLEDDTENQAGSGLKKDATGYNCGSGGNAFLAIVGTEVPQSEEHGLYNNRP